LKVKVRTVLFLPVGARALRTLEEDRKGEGWPDAVRADDVSYYLERKEGVSSITGIQLKGRFHFGRRLKLAPGLLKKAPG